MTDAEETYSTQKILMRAPGLDDMNNRLAAFVGTGKSGMVEWLLYINEKQFDQLNKPGYLTINAENGAKLNDF